MSRPVRLAKPLYVPSERERSREYKPTYHVRYNPEAWQPRVEWLCIAPTPDYSHLHEYNR